MTCVLLLFGATPDGVAQPGMAAKAASKPAAEEGARWQDLKPAQREALKPLEREWSGIDAPRKQKWLELSARVPSMSADERERVQARMADWAKLTPRERGQARLNFEEAKALPRQDRKARWEAYQALSPEQKRELAERAAPRPATAQVDGGPATSGTGANTADARRAAGNGGGASRERAARIDRDAPSQGKQNLVPNPSFSAPPKPIGPTVVQAQPGATTSLISKRPAPPSHQQTGLPKIVATPEFVDKSTLLPRRGPQGAAARPASQVERSPAK